jgi:hypothetical protein
MSLKLLLYGQNDSINAQPDVALTGDPGTDQLTLTNAGYLGGIIMALATSATQGRGSVIQPCNAATQVPFSTLISGPGEFAGAIGPSGSGKAPCVRALWQGTVDTQAYDTTVTYVVGNPLYCGTGAKKGLYTSAVPANGSTGINPVGICTQIPTASNPLLGVASLL